MNPTQARRNVRNHIIRNPTEVVIRRIQETDDGAGGVIRKEMALPAQIVRVFISGAQQQETTAVGGVAQKQRWGMLAEHDADIQVGDTLVHAGSRFVVRDANHASTGGEAVALHCELDEVR